MPITLVVMSRLDAAQTPTTERCLEQDTVTIGRATVNDLCLPDPKKLISSRHAQIRRTDDGFVLLDMESTNGTILNEQRLVTGTAHTLKPGDRIRIGHFTIQVAAVSVPACPVAPLAKALHSTGDASISNNGFRPSDELIYNLNRLYAESTAGQSLPDDRAERLAAVLRQATRRLNVTDSTALLNDVERHFESDGRHEILPIEGVGNRSAPAHSLSAGDAAYEGVSSLARQYCPGWGNDVSADLVLRFLRRIDLVIGVTVHSLSEAVKGRREFAREFEVEATRLLSWVPNRIKLAEGAQEIGAYLLDPRKEDVDQEMITVELKGLFHDLALHQLGLVAGFRECLRGLLAELDPTLFEAEPKQGGSFEIGRLKLPMHRSSVEKEAWIRFKNRHAQLSEEEVKVFEKILAPHFSKGYMSVQKAKSHR
jgi:type VI secretion system protein ImpI